MYLAHPCLLWNCFSPFGSSPRWGKASIAYSSAEEAKQCLFKHPVLIMSEAHRICWQKGQILALKPYFLWPKEGRDGFQLGCWVPSPQASAESSPSLWLVLVSLCSAVWLCLRSHSLCPKFRLHPVCGNELLEKISAELSLTKSSSVCSPCHSTLWGSGSTGWPTNHPCQPT